MNLEAASSQERVPVKMSGTRSSYHGQIGELMKIHIINILLSIVTLGIYSFWGKTRIRQYMTSHITLAKDRFEYTGTGKELFIGWLKALVVFLPVAIGLQIPGLNLIVLPIFFGLISVAVYLALRYRLSRTRWRGIRFSLGGSAKSYMWIAIKRTLINIVTLGLKIPKSDIIKWSYIAGNMKYGDLGFKYSGTHQGLFKIHIKTLIIGVLIVVAFVAIGFGIGAIDGEEGMTIGGIIGFYLGLITAAFVRVRYHAALWREKFRTLELNGIRFKAEVDGGDLFRLYFTNFLIVLFTLGIGKPIALHRTLSFFTHNLLVGGNLDELKAAQAATAQSTGTGDALATDLGVEGGLDLGL